MTATSPPVTRAGLPPALLAELVLGAVVLVHLTIVEVLFFTAGTGKNSVLTVAKFFGLHAAADHDAAAAAGGPAAVAGPPDRHGPAHRLAPLGRLHAALDGPHARHARSCSATRGSTRRRCARRSWRWPACPPRCSGMCAAASSSSWSPCSVRYVRRRLQLRDLARPAPAALPGARRSALIHQVLEGTTFKSSPARDGLLVDAVGARRSARCWSAGSSCRCGATPATGSGSPRSCRSRDNVVSVYVTGRAPGPAAGPGRASSSSGASPATTAGGRPTRSRCRRRPTAGRCG